MNVHEIIKKEVGTKVYHIHRGEMKKWILFGYHPRNDKYYYFISDSNCNNVMCMYLGTDGVGDWVVDYNDAKEIMWSQMVIEMRSINRIYFDGVKELSNE